MIHGGSGREKRNKETFAPKQKQSIVSDKSLK
jgi:hypothetical protein